MLEKNILINSIRMACDWIIDIAMVKTKELPDDTINSQLFPYNSWVGSVRGEYSVASKTWSYFCPIWHTGQAVKALLMAADFFDEEKYLDAAKMGTNFILDNQIWNESDVNHGLILAFEDFPGKVNTSAILECMHGLMLLADKLESQDIWDRIIAAGYFLVNKMYLPEFGLFRDGYDPAKHNIVLPNPFRTKNDIGGRPLLDDGIFMKLFEKTGEDCLKKIHLDISERLIKDQNPPGNWLDYAPCISETGAFHPRHTYWWGLPLLDTYRITNDERFLDVAIASGRFCENSMRADGGWFRGFYLNNKTDSFGHATSGSACAAVLWLELFNETGELHWLNLVETALGYCQRVQFTNTQDPNLLGAILEKVLPPDGSDRSPYYIRDLGTIFYVIAALKFIESRDICDTRNKLIRTAVCD